MRVARRANQEEGRVHVCHFAAMIAAEHATQTWSVTENANTSLAKTTALDEKLALCDWPRQTTLAKLQTWDSFAKYIKFLLQE